MGGSNELQKKYLALQQLNHSLESECIFLKQALLQSEHRFNEYLLNFRSEFINSCQQPYVDDESEVVKVGLSFDDEVSPHFQPEVELEENSSLLEVSLVKVQEQKVSLVESQINDSLQRKFKLKSFRGFQGEIISEAERGRDIFVHMPPG